MVKKEAVDAGEKAEENWTSGIVRKEALDAEEMKGNVREPDGMPRSQQDLPKKEGGQLSHFSTVPWHLGKSKHFPKPE